MWVEGISLLLGVVVLTGLSVAVLSLGLRLLRRARARTRERDEQLAKVARAMATVRLAAERGSINDDTRSKLLSHLHDVHEALLAKPVNSGE